MRAHILRTLSIAVMITVLSVGAAHARSSARVKLQRGTGAVKWGDFEKDVSAETGWQSLDRGDVLTTGKKSTAVIDLGQCGKLEVGPQSDLKVVGMSFSEKEEGADKVDIHLRSGHLRALIGVADKAQKDGDKRPPACQMNVQFGGLMLRGNRYDATIEHPEEGQYHASLARGKASLEHDSGVMVVLRSGVTIEDGPPLQTTADSTNEVPLALSSPGSVVYALLPGQRATVRPVEDGVILKNEAENGDLYAIEWDGAPAVEIAPGEERFFGVSAQDIPWQRRLAHTMRLAQVLRDTFGDVLAGMPQERSEPVDAVNERAKVWEEMGRYPTRRRGGDRSPSR